MTRGIYYFGVKLPLAVFLLSLFFILPLHAQEETEIEEIVVVGVRSSIEKSIDDKRNASGIKDVITAEDIGQLPDDNIAEALQRVTGIQMARTAEGGGSTVQIRGVSNNNVQINGQDFVGGVGGDRSVNFGDIPSELFSGIEVLKTQTASMTEGSLGGTVNFKTRRPLEINKDRFGSISAKGKYADITKDDNQHPLDRFPDVNVFVARNFRDTGIGDIGILANFNRKLNIARSDAFGGGDWGTAPAVWARYLGNKAITPIPGPIRQPAQDWNLAKTNLLDPNGDGTRDAKDVYYTPADFIAHSRYVETQTNSLNATLQWQPSYNLNFFMDYTTTNTDEKRSGSQFRVIMP
ncbi:MAG: TonB-dependent receptor plug domain-containing protein, partial [Parvibaculales bacterium]